MPLARNATINEPHYANANNEIRFTLPLTIHTPCSIIASAYVTRHAPDRGFNGLVQNSVNKAEKRPAACRLIQLLTPADDSEWSVG